MTRGSFRPSIQGSSSAAATFFILASPFLVFLREHRYPYLRSDVLLCSIAIAAAAALVGVTAQRWRHAAPIVLAAPITLFIDVQFGILNDGYRLAAAFAVVCAALMPFPAHATRVLAAAGAVTFGMTFLLPRSAVSIHSPPNTSSGPSQLPPIVHVVLDAQIGVEGLRGVAGGEPLGNELRAFFRRRGFLLFGGAYSEHFETFRSLSHELNFLPGQHAAGLYAKDGRSHAWRLTRNAYFDDLVRTGYNVTVYQSTFLNVCVNMRALAGCETYDPSGIAELQSTSLTVFDKAFAIMRIYVGRTQLYRELTFQYRKLQWRLLEWGVPLPIWQHTPNIASPLATMEVMRRIALDLRDTARGDYVFAHLLAPHEPYLFDANCAPRAPTQWLTRGAAEAGNAATNTAESRDKRYRGYLDQVRCVLSRLDDILDAMRPDLAEDAIFIVQGDHGSRITISDPDPLLDTASVVSPRDYADSYSTLFAVRAPKLAPGYNEEMLPIACLLKALAEADYEHTSNIEACASPAAVFVAGSGGRIEAQPLASFD